MNLKSISGNTKALFKFSIAALIYAAFAGYLYCPYFRHFDKVDWLFLVNVFLAALGGYILTRRWVAVFEGSFFAGAVYGFGPFMLGLGKFHPAAGLFAAVVPWLFVPAVFISVGRSRLVRWLLVALPFLVTAVFFVTAAHFRLFAVPTQLKPTAADFAGLLAPLVAAKRNLTLLGFYHIPIAMLFTGFVMLMMAKRYWVMVLLAVGFVPAFCEPFFSVSPVMWLVFPTLFCSVIIALGMQGVSLAGFADRGWVLTAAAVSGALAVATLLLASKYFQSFAGLADGYAKLLLQTGKMYSLGMVTAGIIFFLVRAKIRAYRLRCIVLSAAIAVDIFVGARFIVDVIF